LIETDRGLFLFTFAALAAVFLILSPYKFLDGDDALQAIWALCRQKGLAPYPFPLHGFESRSGTFLLIYLFSFIAGSPLLAYGILCALASALSLSILLLYSNELLGTIPKPVHLAVLAGLTPEIIYAGLYPNAAIIGYCFGFLSLYLSLRFLKKDKNSPYFVLSGMLFGTALLCSASSAYLALAFPLQHLFLKKQRKLADVMIRFGYEVGCGGLFYFLALRAMGLPPLAALTEFSEVTGGYAGADIKYTIITLLGALNPWTAAILPVAFVLLLRKKAFLPLTVGLFTAPVYFIMVRNLVKSFQHGLAVYLLVCISGVIIWEMLGKKSLCAAYFALLVLPLFLGLRLYLPEQPHRGPGFSEIDTGQGLTLDQKDQRGLSGYVIWQSSKYILAGRGIRLVLGSGFMLPSVDGGRALGGHFWVWVKDWRDYLDYTNKSADTALKGGDQDIVMGQYAVGAIALYKLVERGYLPAHFKSDHEYFFQKNGKIIRTYWYFNELAEQLDKKSLNFGKLASRIDRGIFVAFPSYAYKLENGSLAIDGYSAEALGCFCFKITKNRL